MQGYPQFSFWILVALAKICFFPHSHKPRKHVVILVGKFLKKPEYPEVRKTYAQQKEAPSLSCPQPLSSVALSHTRVCK